MDKNLRIQVIMSAMDKLTGPLRSVGGASAKARAELKATHAQLTKLNQQSKLIATFRQVRGALRDVDRELVGARAKANQLGQEFSKIENPTRKVTRAFNAAKREVEQLEKRQQTQRRTLQDLRRTMNDAGLEAGSYARHQREIRTATDDANRALERQKAKLKDLDRRQHQMAKGRAAGQRISDVSGKAAVAGAAGLGAGAAALAPFNASGAADRDFQSRLTTVGLRANIARADRTKLGEYLLEQAVAVNQLPQDLLDGFDILVSSGQEAKDARKLVSPIGKAATAWETTFADVAASDLALIEKMGIKPEEIDRIHSIMSFAGKEGKFEQADMAASFPELTAAMKGLKQGGVAGVADLAAGTQAVMKNAGNASTAANNLKNLLDKLTAPEVEKNFSKLGVNLPAELAKANAEGKPLLDTVVELMKVATKGDEMKLGRIFGDVQARDAARALWQNQAFYQQVRDQSLLAKGEVGRDFKERKGDAAYTEKSVQVAQSVAEITVGGALRDMIVSLLEPLKEFFLQIGQFAKAHPGIVKFAAVAAGVLAVFGAIALVIGAVLAPLAILAVVAGAIGIGLLPLLAIIAGVAIAIGALVLGVMMLRKRWAETVVMWKDFWANRKEDANNFLLWFNTLPQVFQTIGRAMMEGLIAGIRFMMDPLGSTVRGVAGMLPEQVKERLGIHSPSRVFAQIGRDTMDGLALGIRGGQRGPLDGVKATAASMAAMMLPAGGAAAMSARPPAAAAAPIAITIQVHAAPGMSAEQLARLTAVEARNAFENLRADPLAAFADYGD